MASDHNSFNSSLRKISQSTAYAHFCERVYGRDLSQFNALDEEQLQFLISTIKKLRPQRILDLGCGLGRITEFLALNSDAMILGIDFADEIVASLKDRSRDRENLDFEVGNLNALSENLGQFDLVIAIDTLCFVTDPNRMILDLRKNLTPDGRLIAFHSYRNKVEGASGPLDPAECTIGLALSAAGFSFEVYDFTENEKRIWQNALVVAGDLRTSFESEDRQSTYEARIWEAERNLNWSREGRYRRSMFVANLNLPCQVLRL